MKPYPREGSLLKSKNILMFTQLFWSRPMKTPSRFVPVVLFAVAIGGCSDPQEAKAASVTGGKHYPHANLSSSSVTKEQKTAGDGKSGVASGNVPVSRFPSCEQIKKTLGPAAAKLVELPDSENGPYKDPHDEGVHCGWHTKQMLEGGADFSQFGGLGVGVVKMDKPYVKADMRQGGFVIDDTRAAGIGAYVLNFDGNEFNLADQIAPLGVQVVIGDTAVIITASGLFLQDVPELAGLTNDWAIGAGVDIWKLMK